MPKKACQKYIGVSLFVELRRKIEQKYSNREISLHVHVGKFPNHPRPSIFQSMYEFSRCFWSIDGTAGGRAGRRLVLGHCRRFSPRLSDDVEENAAEKLKNPFFLSPSLAAQKRCHRCRGRQDKSVLVFSLAGSFIFVLIEQLGLGRDQATHINTFERLVPSKFRQLDVSSRIGAGRLRCCNRYRHRRRCC